MAAVRATLSAFPAANEASDCQLSFGAVAAEETVRSQDTITFRPATKLANPAGYMLTKGKWQVVVTPAP